MCKYVETRIRSWPPPRRSDTTLFTHRLRRPYSLSIAAAPVGCVCVPVCSGHRGNPPFLKSHLRMCVRVPAGCACLVFPRGCPPPPPPALLRPLRRRRRRRCRPRRRSPSCLLFLAHPLYPFYPYGPSFPSASLSDFLPPHRRSPSLLSSFPLLLCRRRFSCLSTRTVSVRRA